MAPPRFWRSRSQRSVESAQLSVPSSVAGASALTSTSTSIAEHAPHAQHAPASNASSALTIRPGQTTPTPARPAQTQTQQPARASTPHLILLTLSLLGAQLAWSLELSYGTPFLLSLGLSPSTTSLVWLAGPVSGMVAQPIVGQLSDASPPGARWRRRGWMLGSTACIVVATLSLAYCEPVAEAIVDFFAVGLGDWDPHRVRAARDVTKVLAVGAFWLLDFALNALQAASRSLILDKVEGSDVDRGNAWMGRMTHVGNILGYTCGFLNLSRLAFLQPLGGDQFRKFAVIALVGLVVCVGITCTFVQEGNPEGDSAQDQGQAQQQQGSTFSSSAHPKHTGDDDSERNRSPLTALRVSLSSIWSTLKTLPRPIRRVCLVQLFAFQGWFPFLFYATTWIGTFEPRGTGRTRREERERRGTEGMLLFALVSLVAGSALPLISLGQRRENTSSVDKMVRRLLGGRGGVTLRTLWTFSCLAHSLLFLLLTFPASNTRHALLLVALTGISWGIASWVPFSLVMSFVREAERGTSPYEFEGDAWAAARRGAGSEERTREALMACGPLQAGSGDGRTTSGSFVARGSEVIRPVGAAGSQGGAQLRRVSGLDQDATGEDDEEEQEQERGEHAPLLGQESPNGRDAIDEARTGAGGTILGIHNLSIVLPQFLVAFIASIIFGFFNGAGEGGGDGGGGDGGAPGVVWVLRYGGLAMLLAAGCTRLVPLVEGEREARARSRGRAGSSD